MERELYDQDHEAYREVVREFIRREVSPYKDEWDDAGIIPREVYQAAAEQGLYAVSVPEKYGGSSIEDYRFRMVVCEEVGRANALSWGLTLALQDDLVLNYLLDLANEEQKQRWLPGFANGNIIGALAMTEPGTGSDLRSMRTTAKRDGDSYVVNGQKTFISSGMTADLVVVAVRTERPDGKLGYSLIVVENDTPGFERGRKLDKIGLPSQDTAELYFNDARVPESNVLGEEGKGLHYLMSHLPQERFGITAMAIATARAIYDMTVEYCKERESFGQRLIDHQHIRFELAEMLTEIEIAQTYVDRSVLDLNAGRLTPIDAAKGKWYVTEMQKRIVDRCLQLHGGYGYMREYPVAKAFVDTRVQTIYGGTTEIMKDLIGRDIAAS